jgi:hypothetical protein
MKPVAHLIAAAAGIRWRVVREAVLAALSHWTLVQYAFPLWLGNSLAAS